MVDIKKVIDVSDNIIPITVRMKEKIINDLDLVINKIGGTRSKLIDAILEFYLYHDDVVIKNGDKQVELKIILKRK